MKIAPKKQERQLFERLLWPTVLVIIFSMVLVSTAMGAIQPLQTKEQTKAVKKPAEKKPQYGGIYRTRTDADPRHLDIHMGIWPQNAIVIHNTNNGLLRLNPQMNGWELDLAESVKQIDETTYKFTIHKGVRFHNVPPVNGRELISEDVKYSIERIAGLHGKKSDFILRYYFEDKIKFIETPDKYTIIIKTVEPYVPFLRYLSSPACAIVAKEVVDQYGDLKNVAIGTGPFLLKEYIKGDHMTLVKNPNYWKKGLPYLDEIQIKIMPDPSSVLSAFIAGRMDGIGIYHHQLETLKKSEPDTIITQLPGTSMWVLRVTPWIEGKKPLRPPFDDKNVRQAIAMAIDKKKLLKLAWGGFGTPAVGVVPPNFEFSLKEADQVKYNPQRAKQLLAEAGYPKGFSVELLTWNLEYMSKPAQVIKEMLKEVGIEVKLTLLEMSQYFNRSYRFDYELSLHVMTSGVDPEEWLKPYFGPLEESTFYKWSNPEIWKLVKDQSLIMNVRKRKAMIREAQLKLLDDSPFVCLYSQDRFIARKPYVHVIKQYAHDYQPLFGELYWMEKH
jgi:peptide/nickel transport system substrate-binding protein